MLVKTANGMAESENTKHLSTLIIKWSGGEYVIEGLEPSWTVLQLKEQIYKQTGVLPERQKLLGLKYKGWSRFMIF